MSSKMNLPWRRIEGSHWMMMLIIFVLGLFNFFWGERVPAGGGLGWDGLQYADMVRHFGSMVVDGRLNSYYAQRIVPLAIVRGMLLIAGSAVSDINIIRAFEVYNLFMLLCACWVWKRVADTVGLSLRGRWIGFAGIFVNYECSKQAFYYPVLTDVTALFIALLLLQYYTQERPFRLFLATLVGAFVWPVASISGACLLFFLNARPPVPSVYPGSNGGAPPQSVRRVSAVVFVVILLLSVAGYLMLTGGDTTVSHACAIPSFIASRMGPSIVPCTIEGLLTGLPVLVGMLIALSILIGSRTFLSAIFLGALKTRLHLAALAIAALVIPSLIVKSISNPALANPTNLQYLIEFILMPPSGKFFLALVTLAVFWGPLTLMLILYWKEFCAEVRQLGPGVLAVIGISIPLGLACEPRFITIGWPFFVLGIVLVLERLHFKPRFDSVLALLIVVYAQFWMKFNLAPWTSADSLEFPKQVYYMHYGLWMSWVSYMFQFPVLILSTIWLRLNVDSSKR